MDFQEQFETFDAKTRAALVFRYREELSSAHVAQLVGERPEQVELRLGRALARLRDRGALTRPLGEDELYQWLDKLRDEPGFSSFSLVLAVRRERGRRRRFGRRAS
ncbi:hypothetical protein [Catenulispora subtropica]|uniref:RNA polymerase, sigma-24 subunit, ECF subfamily n=1 Tax=Catenulispora subtropica TaxID=450798 RepID=A0ABP5CEY4_9ACTN